MASLYTSGIAASSTSMRGRNTYTSLPQIPPTPKWKISTMEECTRISGEAPHKACVFIFFTAHLLTRTTTRKLCGTTSCCFSNHRLPNARNDDQATSNAVLAPLLALCALGHLPPAPTAKTAPNQTCDEGPIAPYDVGAATSIFSDDFSGPFSSLHLPGDMRLTAAGP